MYKTQLKIDWTATKLKAADGKLLVKYKATLDIPWKCWGKVWQDQKWTIMKWNAGRCKQWCIYHPQCYRIVGEENDLLRAKNMVAHMIEEYVKHGGWPLACQSCGQFGYWANIEFCPHCMGTWEDNQIKHLREEYANENDGLLPGR